ncbi:MAG TPA: glycosyltransferase family 9 protein [Vicinamibacterales bacterium]|jgi:lipopolysaccharide heptosyltransferase I|nr:glycosyltransferase family 9 protein [Vicinamibacterales bacterium]
MNLLIVRLGALGDVVHAIPAAAAIRAGLPDARIDWLVDARYRAIVDLVPVVDHVIPLERPALRGWTHAIGALRQTAYDVAIDLQGLLKSAVLARASGATRVVGFSIWHLREKTARPFYSAAGGSEGGHVIEKNLRLLQTLGIDDREIRFPISGAASAALERFRERVPAERPFALINPGAAWPNKRWPAERFGELAAFLHDACGMTPVVIWGPGEEALVASVIGASTGTAIAAPPTGITDLVAFARAAALMVSGDTGPLHIATAVGTPTVSLFGPTDPLRNGPVRADDVVVSRYESCGCQYDRECHEAAWCLADVTVAEVSAAVQRRLSAGTARG